MPLILLFMFAVLALLPLDSFAAAKAPFYYGGWLPFWQKLNGAADITDNLGKFHELSPFSYEVGANGKLIDKLKITEGFWPTWLLALRDLKIKIIPTIAWFDGPAIHKLLSNKKTRIAHEDAITKLVMDRNFDGIDIDYEAKLADTKPYFSLFIKGLAIRLHPKKKFLACTIEVRTPLASLYKTIPKDVARANDYATLNKYCDEVRIMAYDQGLIDIKLKAQKGSDTLYAPVADPDWVEKVLKEALQTIRPQKIVLGIPTYGYEYQVRWENGITTYQRLRSHTFVQAMERAASYGAIPVRTSAGELAFSYATSTWVSGVSSSLTWYASSTLPAAIASTPTAMTTRFVSFSDAESARQKIKLARKLGIRGVVFFKFDGQQDPLLWSVMK